MKTDSFERLMLLHNESVRLCDVIFQILQDERIHLIALDTPKVSEILLQKDHTVRTLEGVRAKILEIFNNEFCVNTPEAFEAMLQPDELLQWRAARESWQKEWGKVATLAHQNQRFLKQSMKNLSRFADHLKQLLGEPSRYSSKGDKVDSSSEGRMLEASC